MILDTLKKKCSKQLAASSMVLLVLFARDEHSHAEAARTAPVTSIVTSVPSESVIGVGDGRVTTRLPPRTG